MDNIEEIEEVKPRIENHVVIAALLLISTFFPWVDTMMISFNLWSIGSQVFDLARNTGQGWLDVLAIFSFPLVAVAVLITFFRKQYHLSYLISFIGGAVTTLIVLYAYVKIQALIGDNPFVQMFGGLGTGFYLGGFFSLLMILNCRGFVTPALAQTVERMLPSPKASPSIEVAKVEVQAKKVSNLNEDELKLYRTPRKKA